jgi:hypothetical protein
VQYQERPCEILNTPQASFSPQSVAQHLDSAFYSMYLPIATSFPEIKTHSQQARADASAADAATQGTLVRLISSQSAVLTPVSVLN